jgi:hypothetical protein
MKLTRTVTVMAALIVAPHANAQTTDASRVQILDARIADAKDAATFCPGSNGPVAIPVAIFRFPPAKITYAPKRYAHRKRGHREAAA